ncbi:MAG: hypothetical protein ACUVX8_05905 [Candidatus Zipacnadales bacterium]
MKETRSAALKYSFALCGRKENTLAAKSDIVITIPADSTPHIQIAHAAVLHAICRLVDEQEW